MLQEGPGSPLARRPGRRKGEGLRPMTSRKAEDETRLGAMREAAEVGIADIEAGRFRVFGSAEELQEHLSALVAEVLGSGVRSPD